VKLVPEHLITVADNRQRKEFDEGKMQELKSSIEERGLLSPIVVRKHISGGYELVAGERRLRSLREIYDFGGSVKFEGMRIEDRTVPIVNLGDLPALEAKELELEENIRRSDLTWQERVAAEAELMQLRSEKAARDGQPAPKPIDLAEELRGKSTIGAANSVRESLILANNLHRPEVKNAKTQTEAFKAMKRVEEAERNAAVAAKMGKEHLSGQHRLVQANCVDWMASQPACSFDVICSDPPYGMGADEFGDGGGRTGGSTGDHFYDDSTESWLELMAAAIPEISRLAKQDAHLYLFCDFDKFHGLKKFVETNGWKVFRTPLIWFKPSAFRAPWPEKGPQRKYECILYAVRGELKSTILAGDVIQCPPDENLGHPAQKPVPLIAELLRRSVRPGMAVLDPFCGSGPIFEAGHSLSAIVTGVEQDPTACGIAAGRLAKLSGVTTHLEIKS
jgi:ParB-like chromosome segregation protein Spo0J/DNA modification methylase